MMDPNHPEQPNPNPAPPPSDPTQQAQVAPPPQQQQATAQPPQPGMPATSMQPQPGPYQQPVKTNTLAIVTLVLAFVFPIAAVVTGFIALSQIKKSGEGGRGLAIGGLVIGFLQFLFLLLILVVFSFGGVQEAARDAERKTDVNALRAYVEAYAAENGGYYPPELDPTLLPGADTEVFRGPGDGEVYTYTVEPIGCSAMCESYTLSAQLEAEGEGVYELSGSRLF